MTHAFKKADPSTVFPPLFEEFPRPAMQDWKAAVENSSKGAAFEKVMGGKRADGLEAPPYSREDLSEPGWPGLFPFLRGCQATAADRGWDVCQEMRLATATQVSQALAREAELGLDGVVLCLDRASRGGLDPDQARTLDVGTSGVSICGLEDMRRVLDGVLSTKLSLQLCAGASGLPLAAFLAAALEDAGMDWEAWRGCVRCDPLGELAMSGVLPRSLLALYDEMATLITWSRECFPKLRIISVSTLPYHEAGAGIAEELALGIATGIEYTRQMISRGHLAQGVLPKVQLELGVGTDFFAEVARLRAARLLWSMVSEAFGARDQASALAIHARTSSRCYSSLDEHTNILRATTAAFAASIGGASSIAVASYDEVSSASSTQEARRIARGVQLLLARESRVGAVQDPVGGARHVEGLTSQIASAAWDLVRKIESKGGMYECLEEGFVQSLLATRRVERLAALACQKAVLVGVNQFASSQDLGKPDKQDWETVAAELSAASQARRESIEGGARGEILGLLADVASSSGPDAVETVMAAARQGATLGQISRALAHNGEPVHVDPLVIERPSQAFEDLKRRAGVHEARVGRRPTVFLSCVGPVTQHKARADFSKGFFEVAGFEVLWEKAAQDGEQAGEFAARSSADVAVLCSTDDAYPALVPAFVASLRRHAPGAIAVLAGYPKDQVEAHRKSGIDEFIHLRADLLSVLGGLFDRIGA